MGGIETHQPSSKKESSSESRGRGWLSTGDGLTIAGIVVTIGLAFSQWKSAERVSERQAEQNMVQVALGILSQKAPRDKEGKLEEFPEDEKVLREWAVNIVDKRAGEKIPTAGKQALIAGQASIKFAGYSDYGNSQNTDARGYNPGDVNQAEFNSGSGDQTNK